LKANCRNNITLVNLTESVNVREREGGKKGKRRKVDLVNRKNHKKQEQKVKKKIVKSIEGHCLCWVDPIDDSCLPTTVQTKYKYLELLLAHRQFIEDILYPTHIVQQKVRKKQK
jgi:hypothetical protein